MARISRVRPHLPWAEVRRHYRQARRPAERRHWLIILSLQADPRPAAVAARQLGVSRSSLNHVVAAYNRLGPAALASDPRAAKAPRAYLSRAEEAAFLRGFLAPAGRGQVSVARPVRQALEARLGHPVHPRTVERLLARHAWRKVVPRPRHPKADAAVQAEHKKKSAPKGSRAGRRRPAPGGAHGPR
jgi:transposase